MGGEGWLVSLVGGQEQDGWDGEDRKGVERFDSRFRTLEKA